MALGNTGITTTVVANELGTSTHDVGALCTSNQINMWSRMKPVHISSATPNRSGEWWKGSDGNAGISYTSTTSYRNIPSMYTSDMLNGWSYARPRGGATSPYRLADFMYYKHDAYPPYDSFTCPAKVSKTGNLTCSMAMTASTTDKTGAGSIVLDDIGDLGDYKFGIIITDTSGTYKGKVGNGTAGMVTYSVSALTQGSTYYVYPFVCKNSFGQNDTDSANTFIPIPNVARASFKVVSAQEAAGLTINLTATQLGTVIKYTISISKSSGSSTFTNNWLQCRFSTSDINDAMLAGESRVNLNTITVSSSSPYTKMGTFTNLDTSKNYYLYLTINTAQYTQRVQPEQTPILPEDPDGPVLQP